MAERPSTKNIAVQIGSAAYSQLLGTARFARNRRWNLTFIEKEPPTNTHFDGMLSTLRVANRPILAFIRRLAAAGVPIVDSGLHHPEIPIARVAGDYEAIGELAVRHFQERSFRHIAFFARDWSIVHKLRFSALERHWTGEKPLLLRPPFAKALKTAPKPLGVLAYNDLDAASFINSCLDLGYEIPGKIAVLGIDNNEIICENQQIPISSVEHDLAQISYERAALLDRMMAGEPPPAKPILIRPHGIVTRASTETIACTDKTVAAALKWIDASLSTSFGSAQLAEALGLSRVKLDRLFASVLGTSVAQTALRLRIKRAKELMKDRSRTFESIARATGFCHAAHFSNAFKKATGLSPRHWVQD